MYYKKDKKGWEKISYFNFNTINIVYKFLKNGSEEIHLKNKAD